jgi:hypothetical protein
MLEVKATLFRIRIDYKTDYILVIQHWTTLDAGKVATPNSRLCWTQVDGFEHECKRCQEIGSWPIAVLPSGAAGAYARMICPSMETAIVHSRA